MRAGPSPVRLCIHSYKYDDYYYCLQGAGLYDSLLTFGNARGLPGRAGYMPSCDALGAVLPFPYAYGMGYIFSRQLVPCSAV